MQSAPESKAMLEVREWKENAWERVAHLPLDEALEMSLRNSIEAAEKAGFSASKVTPNRKPTR